MYFSYQLISLDFPSDSVFYTVKQLPASDLKEQLYFIVFLTHSQSFHLCDYRESDCVFFLVVCACGSLELRYNTRNVLISSEQFAPWARCRVCFSAEVSGFNAFSVTPPEGTLYTVLEQMRLFLNLPSWTLQDE